jgi:hypothetical protein
MARMACAMMLTGLLTGGVSANVIQFAVDGVPIGAGDVVEVMPGDLLTLGIYVVPDQPICTFWVEMVFAGPWPVPPLPQIDNPPSDALILNGDVRMIGDWDNEFAAAFYSFTYDVYSVGSFLSWLDGLEPQSEPGVTAEFDLHVPDVAISTELACEFAFGEVGWRDGWDDDPVMVPATIVPATLRVIFPEPVSVALLALGGVVALRRRMT